MNEQKSSFRKSMILIAFGVILFCVLQNLGDVVAGIQRIWDVLLPITLGLCIAFVCNVLMSSCERVLAKIFGKHQPKGRGLRVMALILTIAILVGVLVLSLVVVIPEIGSAIGILVDQMPQSMNELSTMIGNLLSQIGLDAKGIESVQTTISDLIDQLLNLIQKEASNIASTALNLTSSLVNTIANLLFAVVIAIYILLDKEKIGRFVKKVMNRFLPEKINNHLLELGQLSYKTFNAFVRGQVLEAIILGLLCFVGLLIFRFPYAVVVSLLVGITALIPILGAWIGGIFSALLILTVSPIKAVLFIVFLLLLQQMEGDLIYPKVVGSTIGLPSVLVLCAVIIGQKTMGIVSMLISVPITAVLYTLLKQAIYNKKVHQKR